MTFLIENIYVCKKTHVSIHKFNLWVGNVSLMITLLALDYILIAMFNFETIPSAFCVRTNKGATIKGEWFIN